MQEELDELPFANTKYAQTGSLFWSIQRTVGMFDVVADFHAVNIFTVLLGNQNALDTSKPWPTGIKRARTLKAKSSFGTPARL